MLYFFSGTDREKARAALNAALEKAAKKVSRIARVTDANTRADLQSVLQGGGMFGETRTIVFDGTLANEEMRDLVTNSLPALKESRETFFILEERPDADTRKRIEKYAERSERFDTAGKRRDGSVFAMANALAKRDKRALWLNYQGELAKGTAPEAIHGVLFWGAKDMLLRSRVGGSSERAQKLVAALAELPHESRRRGEELEYALERFVLSGL
ncbi:MAG: hypothetical protein AAB804_01785 [Patescibacteria group bacterium]